MGREQSQVWGWLCGGTEELRQRVWRAYSSASRAGHIRCRSRYLCLQALPEKDARPGLRSPCYFQSMRGPLLQQVSGAEAQQRASRRLPGRSPCSAVGRRRSR